MPGESVGAAHGAAAALVRRDRLARLGSGVTGAAGLAARLAPEAERPARGILEPHMETLRTGGGKA